MAWTLGISRWLGRAGGSGDAASGDTSCGAAGLAAQATCRRAPRPPMRACTHCRIQQAVMEAYREATMREELAKAVDLALAGDWQAAHEICQRHESDRTACWLHAVLHKIEPDEANARYWYREAGQFYESYADSRAELQAIKAVLTY